MRFAYFPDLPSQYCIMEQGNKARAKIQYAGMVDPGIKGTLQRIEETDLGRVWYKVTKKTV